MVKSQIIAIALIFALGCLAGYYYEGYRYEALLEIAADQARELGEEKRISAGLGEEYTKLISKHFRGGENDTRNKHRR